VRLTSVAPGLLALLGCLGVVTGAEPVPTPSGAATTEAGTSTEVVVGSAERLAGQGKYAEAINLLNGWLAENPKDQVARQHLLGIKVAQKEADIRAVLNEQSSGTGLILADPDYEAARARADTDVQRRLAVVEYFLSQNRFTDAAQGCNAILRDHPHDDATMRLKFRILNTIVDKERKELLKQQESERGNALNDVIEDNTFPRDKLRVQRQVFVFQEDIDEIERAKVKAKLQERITLNQDQAKVWDVMKTLFAIAGINYVVLDSAISDETVSLHLVDDTVESVLNSVGKLAKVRFSYTDGTVFVSSDADDGLVTEIIRLRSGLTNVEAEVNSSNFNNGGASGGGANGGGGIGNNNGGIGANGNQAIGRNGQGQNGRNAPGAPGGANGKGGQNGGQGGDKSDLEKFLEKLPDIVTGWQETHKWHLDRKSNTLYLRASPWVISEVKRLLHAMDYNNVQVLIESRFVEVSEEALRQIGVDWGAFQGTNPANANWAGGNGSPITPSSVAGGTNPVSAVFPSGTATGTGSILSGLVQTNGFTLNASLKALEATSKADTLAEPKILTLNNAQGLIEITHTVTYVSGVDFQTFTSSTNQPNNTNGIITNSGQVPNPKFDEAKEGYQLKITPSVARNSDVITLHLLPTVQKLIGLSNQPISYQPSSNSTTPEVFNIQKPEFATRTLETVLHIQNGQTVALGGLSDAFENQTESGTPFLSKIPILGWLFKSQTKSNQRRNLIILVTANIVDPSGSKVGDELEHLRDTARILLPESGIKGMEPDKPVMTEAAHPAGPNPDIDTQDAENPNRDSMKGRRR
jgi:type II secretory pathway component GspD/PulD (secretin)